MRVTYFLDYITNDKDESTAIFINEEDVNSVLSTEDILRFNTPWTEKKRRL